MSRTGGGGPRLLRTTTRTVQLVVASHTRMSRKSHALLYSGASAFCIDFVVPSILKPTHSSVWVPSRGNHRSMQWSTSTQTLWSSDWCALTLHHGVVVMIRYHATFTSHECPCCPPQVLLHQIRATSASMAVRHSPTTLPDYMGEEVRPNVRLGLIHQ